MNQLTKATLGKEHCREPRTKFLILYSAKASASGKELFLKQLEAIVESVKQNRLKIERRQQEEKSKRDTFNIQFTQLVEKARQYAKVFKDFQEVSEII